MSKLQPRDALHGIAGGAAAEVPNAPLPLGVLTLAGNGPPVRIITIQAYGLGSIPDDIIAAAADEAGLQMIDVRRFMGALKARVAAI